MENTVTELLNLGHEVVVITIGRKRGLEVNGRLSIYRIKPFNVFSFLDINERPIWLRLFWHPFDVLNLSSYREVKNILRAQKPAVVITHNLKGIGYLIPLAIKRCKIRHWHVVHDVQLSRPSGLILFGQEKPFLIIDKVYEKICRKLFGAPQYVISPSAWLLNYYKQRGFFYHSKKLVLPNPVIFRKVEAAERLENKDKIIMLYAGQLIWHKGIEFLIKTCKDLPAKNWRLIIAGAGPDETKVKELVADDERFQFVGRVDQSRMIEFYRQADLTVVPSLCYENSPTVIYESLVANVPVIASDIGGIGEIVKDDYNGFTFAPGNQKNLTEVLEHFLNRPQVISELKKNCFVSVRNFSVSNYVKKLVELI